MPDSLRLEQLSKRYGQGPYVLKDVNHTFHPGTGTVLSGPNGSGKTTLLRLLNLTAYPSEGTIHYGNLHIHQNPYAYLGNVGIVHDEDALPHYLTALELLEFILRQREKWSPDSLAAIHALLDQVLLDDQRDDLISTYSSGMRKKTQIAAALIAQPAILLLDEPLRGLDVDSRAATVAIFQTFKDAGGILIMASHLHETVAPLVNASIELEKKAPQEA